MRGSCDGSYWMQAAYCQAISRQAVEYGTAGELRWKRGGCKWMGWRNAMLEWLFFRSNCRVADGASSSSVVGRGLEVDGDDGFKSDARGGARDRQHKPNFSRLRSLSKQSCTAAGLLFHQIPRHAIFLGVYVKQALRCPLSRGAHAQGRLHAANRAAVAMHQPTILSARVRRGISATILLL